MTYAAHWARCWSLVGAVGVGLSFLVWQPLSVLAAFLAAAACAGTVLALLAPAAGPRSPRAAVRWSRIGTRAGLIAAGVIAIGGFSAVLPALALPLVAAAGVSHPWCVDQVKRWRDSERTHEAGASASQPAGFDHPSPGETLTRVGPVPEWPGQSGCRLDLSAGAAEELTDRDLCLEWRRSFITLQSARSAHDLARVVSQRQIYLDEMERRSPTGLQAWLASGARAAGGPERFLNEQRHDDDQSDAA